MASPGNEHCANCVPICRHWVDLCAGGDAVYRYRYYTNFLLVCRGHSLAPLRVISLQNGVDRGDFYRDYYATDGVSLSICLMVCPGLLFTARPLCPMWRTKLSMGWIDPRVGLGREEIFKGFLVGWVGSRDGKISKKSKTRSTAVLLLTIVMFVDWCLTDSRDVSVK